MNDDKEWFILNVLIPSLGGVDAFIDSVDPATLAYAKKRPTFATLPNDVVGSILSHTDLRDVRSVRKVCRQWAGETRKSLFWMKKIEAVKLLMIEWKSNSVAAIMAFNTFNSPFQETLRDQVEWLFHWNSWVDISPNKKCIIVTRRTSHSTAYEEWYDTITNKCKEVKWFETQLGHPFDYYGKYVCKSDCISIRYLETLKYDCPTVKRLVQHFKNGDTYDGTGIYITKDAKDHYFAHGDGKWTFADGSELEGEMVACRGEPRFKRIKH